jgi:ribosomal protein S21
MALNYIALPRDGVVFAPGELERALGRMKKGLAQSGLLRELKDRSAYRKPSQRKRLKAQRARARVRRAVMKSAARFEWYARQVEEMKQRKG